MQICEILSRDNRFKYMLLNRLQSDCYTYINHGGKLWGITPLEHVKTMQAIYDNLKVKPEWLTDKELKNLTYRLIGRENI